MNGVKYRQILDGHLLQSANDNRLRWRITFQQDNDSKYTVKATLEWLQNNNVKLWVAQLKPRPESHWKSMEKIWRWLSLPV
jgi:hypothetical protein